MPHIDYFCATLSPFVYLAGTRPQEIADRHGATITYKPFDIGAIFGRTGGLPFGERHPSRNEWRAQDLQRQAKKLGVPFNIRPAHWPTNGAPASYAIIAAQQVGGGDLAKLLDRICTCVWAEEKDIADDGVIGDCLEQTGFDRGLTLSGLVVGAETYAANLEEAVNRGVFGAPFLFADGDQRFWGQDRLDDLDAYLAGDL